MKKNQVIRTILKLAIAFSVFISGSIFAYDTIIIYGRETCGLTKRFRNQLETERIQYTFYDVDRYANKSQEMFTKVDRFYPGVETVKFPVVDVNGTVLISPDVPTFKQYLNTQVTQTYQNNYNYNNYSNQNQYNYPIQVYGRETCGLTKYFISQLQANGTNYVFYDVDNDYNRNNEMFNKVYAKYPDINTFKFPVVDVQGNILLSPNFNDFKNVYLAGNTSNKPAQVATPKPQIKKTPPQKQAAIKTNVYSSNNVVVLYGRESCGLTQSFRRQLEADNTRYTFYDVDLDQMRQSEMFNKVNYYYPGMEMITFPVVEVNGRVLISPQYGDFIRYLRVNPTQSSNFPVLPSDQSPVLIYGSESCKLTRNFRKQLDQNKTNYTFFDVEKDTNKQTEMFSKVNTYYPDLAVIMYPVVDVNGSILVSPNISEFNKIQKQ
ncbi:MAG: hypothetical protein H7A23_18420 [Leptospiraceae bacterium]|nr:hypothetical protein [Leptospiraceae bacterium]MCP5496526.1 hypothetical protein [Leptospiraceae bacterium]